MSSEPVVPDSLEVAVGTMVGRLPEVPPFDVVAKGRVLAAIESVVLEALQRPPCVVSFSGGRDSSVVLAVATAVARRETLPLPVPVTNVYPGLAETDEHAWQELVVAHLGLSDWVRKPAADADAIGPTAMACLRQIGVAFPSNAYLHAPVLEECRGGALLSGIGGDEMFDSPGAIWLRWIRGLERPRRSRLRPAVREMLPDRHWRDSGMIYERASWLLPDAVEQLRARYARASSRRHRWDALVREWSADRYYQAAYSTIGRLAAVYDAQAVTPFLEPEVIAAIAA
ncbi:MAG: asparagine synthase-related protein, partial [Acidimicrobiales bacterium]